MSTIINVGLIGNAVLEEALATERSHNFNLKKIFANDKITAGVAKTQYPNAEIVNDIKAIIEDAGIELVILSEPSSKDSQIIQHIMKAGKKVRII
jgi:NADH/NAD ratio-sensing transcriptional regulator Rex